MFPSTQPLMFLTAVYVNLSRMSSLDCSDVQAGNRCCWIQDPTIGRTSVVVPKYVNASVNFTPVATHISCLFSGYFWPWKSLDSAPTAGCHSSNLWLQSVYWNRRRAKIPAAMVRKASLVFLSMTLLSAAWPSHKANGQALKLQIFEQCIFVKTKRIKGPDNPTSEVWCFSPIYWVWDEWCKMSSVCLSAVRWAVWDEWYVMTGERLAVGDEWYEMTGVRYVLWNECCETSAVRWVVWDEWCEMSGVRWVVWDEWCEMSGYVVSGCVMSGERWLVRDELCVRWGVWEMSSE